MEPTIIEKLEKILAKGQIEELTALHPDYADILSTMREQIAKGYPIYFFHYTEYGGQKGSFYACLPLEDFINTLYATIYGKQKMY